MERGGMWVCEIYTEREREREREVCKNKMMYT